MTSGNTLSEITQPVGSASGTHAGRRPCHSPPPTPPSWPTTPPRSRTPRWPTPPRPSTPPGCGLGKRQARRERDARRTAPRALDARRTRRYIRHVQLTASPRDKAIALLPYYAGLRISEVVGLDLADVRLSARKGELRIRGKGRDGGKIRLLPVHADLRQALTDWLEARADWKGAGTHAAVFLNHRGGRLGDRAARNIITGLGDAVGLGDDPTEPFSPHVLRHTFATQLIRDGKDPILVAELLGHGSLNTRRYALPTEADKEAALDVLITDHWPEQQTGSERVPRLSLPYPSPAGGHRVRATVGECGGQLPTPFDPGQGPLVDAGERSRPCLRMSH
ncbi:hypothetical protein E1292_36070 [Nonomuraea deserti]|uniref:Tyr recombinase domain-containing protein n=1 Tax=Nonomuraea deserti TaxID=1848322 RepID=A0A4V2Y917_9ACTN|nr:tyrosine-type recombinase/integrase [Nonomuraea deserti]TDC98025.1 hypothetical protein E1292_36070 [Nonomuraea deserti]